MAHNNIQAGHHFLLSFRRHTFLHRPPTFSSCLEDRDEHAFLLLGMVEYSNFRLHSLDSLPVHMRFTTLLMVLKRLDEILQYYYLNYDLLLAAVILAAISNLSRDHSIFLLFFEH